MPHLGPREELEFDTTACGLFMRSTKEFSSTVPGADENILTAPALTHTSLLFLAYQIDGDCDA